MPDKAWHWTIFSLKIKKSFYSRITKALYITSNCKIALRVIFVEENWYKDYGFESNPFEINPLNDEDRTLFERDNELKEVAYRINSDNMLFIEGAKGKGKTALLKHAINLFKGKGKVIYVDSNAVNKKLNIEQLLVGAKKVNLSNEKYPKGMILLLDNVDELSRLNNERIKYFFDQGYLKSVIFAGTNYNKVSFSDSIKSRIGNRIIKLKQLSANAAVDLILDRLGTENNGLLSEEIIKYVYEKSNGDLKKLLVNTYLACDYTLKNEEETVTPELVDEALSLGVDKESEVAQELEDEKQTIEESKHCEECNSKLVKVGDYYKCKNCDTFCTSCGGSVHEDDKACPQCGAKFD